MDLTNTKRSLYSMENGDSGPPIGTDTTTSGKCVPSAVALTSSELNGLTRLVSAKSWSCTLPLPAPPLPPPTVIVFEIPHDQLRMSLDPTSAMVSVPALLSGAAD